MLIKALCDYYDILAKNGKVLPDGYSNVKVHYIVSLTKDGKIDDIINFQESIKTEDKNGKVKEKFAPKIVRMPKRTEKPGIDGNIIEHRPIYIFGLNFEGDKLNPVDKTDKAKKSHEAFVKKNLEFISGIDSPVVNAFRKFIENWTPNFEVENEFLLSLGKAYATSNFAFCLSGNIDKLLHEDIQINERWRETVYNNGESSEGISTQCAISGKVEPIARIHNKISGMLGGSATGKVLVCFKNSSESSYGNEQSYNSSISESAMKKYTETLNYLISNKEHRSIIDDITVIHWAMSENENYNDIFSALMLEDTKMDSESVNNMLKLLMNSAREGNLTKDRIGSLDDINTDVDFYLVGLKPNSSRIAMKFMYKKQFGEILKNIAIHQNDLQVSDTMNPIPLWRIKKELISPKSKTQVADPALVSKIFESVIYGTNYPDFLFSTIIKRIKTDTNISINTTRAGIVKAFINRKSRLLGQKEELKLALDKNNTNTAYLCGRLFAVLERLQQSASNNQLNRTIKDAYFASASSKPAIIFPKLLKLAQNHLNKVKSTSYWNILIGEIIDKINGEFPENLYLLEQGKFIIGYYQQYQDFFVKKEEKKEENENDN